MAFNNTESYVNKNTFISKDKKIAEPITASVVAGAFVIGAATAAGAVVGEALAKEVVNVVKDTAKGGASPKGATA